MRKKNAKYKKYRLCLRTVGTEFQTFFAVLKKICVFAMEVYPVIIRDTHGVLSQ